ncbi:hypothetical protein [Ilumatobacter coccineus]|uniref:Nitrate ABC transporter substrate-binding protein n=1 Tax=Ilumatobacter coccineus (strain NBRC 103263 / KCTC 29153 / YM16-304) TaxID=1313172 RepID=A0A6C7E916_ILUCY|nr:hypothetical protein [Ilumatobacter coccineus]BAN02853.1 hypothetical protein YM304_25390 [Ilumatobacter coccineus YM16-304]
MVIRRCAVLIVAVSGLVSCSGGNDAVQSAPDSSSATSTSTPAVDFTEVETTLPERETFTDGPLAEVCPATITLQIDDLPSVEHGPLFRLLGDDPSVDGATQVISGPLRRSDGTVEDVIVEIRAGGPAVEFRNPIDVMSADPTITLAEASTDELADAADTFPTVGVVTLTDISHQMLMWDPATYPDVTSLDDLAATGPEIRHLPDEGFISFLVEQGVLDSDDLDDDFFGEPAAFVASGGSLVQQGDALVEPFLFPSLPQWSAPIDYALAAESGWTSYDDSLVVTSEFADEQRSCLGRLVPVIQESIVAYVVDPSPTNELMASVRELFNPLTRAAPELLDQGVASGVATGIFGGGPDGVVGSFDVDRVASFVDTIGGATAGDDLVTNDFVDLAVTL